jgi:hypothetical protein
MVIAFAENKEDLFFFQTKEPTLKLSELKEIIGDELLSKDNLIKLIDNNLIHSKDKKDVFVFVKQQLKLHKEDLTIINSLLKDGHSLKKCVQASEQKNEERKEKAEIKEKRKAGNKKVSVEIDQPKKNNRSRNRFT